MRQPLIAGNWKMNGDLQFNVNLLNELLAGISEIKVAEMAVLPPYVYLAQVQAALTGSKIRWGAQNVSAHANGAYTGEISAQMLKDFQCCYVIIGHSERRQYYSETNETVAQKMITAMQIDLIPIVCVGETLQQREAGKTFEIIKQQLEALLHLDHNLLASKTWIIAYEPVWAIGTGKSATADEAQAVHFAIRQQLKAYNANLAQSCRIIYGGSVKPDNAKTLLSMPDVDGALVGGASLKAKDFLELGKICNHLF